jgi:hypothetical protein
MVLSELCPSEGNIMEEPNHKSEGVINGNLVRSIHDPDAASSTVMSEGHAHKRRSSSQCNRSRTTHSNRGQNTGYLPAG